MDVADTKTNAKTKTQTNKKCLCYIFEEHGVLGEDVRTVDMVDMTMADMEDIDMVHMDMVFEHPRVHAFGNGT